MHYLEVYHLKGAFPKNKHSRGNLTSTNFKRKFSKSFTLEEEEWVVVVVYLTTKSLLVPRL
jgi:hypothetical protein